LFLPPLELAQQPSFPSPPRSPNSFHPPFCSILSMTNGRHKIWFFFPEPPCLSSERLVVRTRSSSSLQVTGSVASVLPYLPLPALSSFMIPALYHLSRHLTPPVSSLCSPPSPDFFNPVSCFCSTGGSRNLFLPSFVSLPPSLLQSISERFPFMSRFSPFLLASWQGALTFPPPTTNFSPWTRVLGARS